MRTESGPVGLEAAGRTLSGSGHRSSALLATWHGSGGSPGRHRGIGTRSLAAHGQEREGAGGDDASSGGGVQVVVDDGASDPRAKGLETAAYASDVPLGRPPVSRVHTLSDRVDEGGRRGAGEVVDAPAAAAASEQPPRQRGKSGTERKSGSGVLGMLRRSFGGKHGKSSS